MEVISKQNKMNVENIKQSSKLISNKAKLITGPSNALKPRLAFGDVGNKLQQHKSQLPTLQQNPQKNSKVTAFGSTVSLPVKKINAKPVSNKALAVKPVASIKLLRPTKENDNSDNLKLPRLVQKLDLEPRPETKINAALNVDCEDDIFLVPEYVKDIMRYLRSLEVKYPIHQDYLKGHASKPSLRAILVDWLAQVCRDFNFTAETLHLTVACVDRYLQIKRQIDRTLLQLVGVAALFLASKYEEMYFVDLDNFVYACDNAYTAKQIMQMERSIFKHLGFSLSRPISLRFLRRNNKVLNVSENQHALGKYILELALQEYSVCHLEPSLQAAAASCLSICIFDPIKTPATVWNEVIQYHSGYQLQELKSTMYEFAALLLIAESWKYQIIREKYSESSQRKIVLHPRLKSKTVLNFASKAKLIEYKK